MDEGGGTERGNDREAIKLCNGKQLTPVAFPDL